MFSKAGALCYGLDLSESVNSAAKNLGKRKNVFLVQADLNNPPFKDNSFDLVYSVGVLHHSPSVRAAVRDVAPLTKRGGLFAVWVYGRMFPRLLDTGRFWRVVLNKLPLPWLYTFCKISVPLYYLYKLPVIGYVRVLFPIAMSPDPAIRVQGTFDSYSPRYAHLTSNTQIANYFQDAGLQDVELGLFPTSARARRR